MACGADVDAIGDLLGIDFRLAAGKLRDDHDFVLVPRLDLDAPAGILQDDHGRVGDDEVFFGAPHLRAGRRRQEQSRESRARERQAGLRDGTSVHRFSIVLRSMAAASKVAFCWYAP